MEDYKGMRRTRRRPARLAQAVEHYEISRYGTLKTWAGQLGMKDAASAAGRRPCRRRTGPTSALTTLAEAAVNLSSGGLIVSLIVSLIIALVPAPPRCSVLPKEKSSTAPCLRG